ncbi:MAG TPA: carotenoid biosynthesis protein, partial [Vicinamibacteria bacterium]|nr:carotenoid biosynthesis protein [Vicinamibacteria bacterium]
FLFLLVFLGVAIRDLGGGRALLFGAWVWLVAWLAEVSSTRGGLPFGLYHYTEATRGQELYLANVPLMDPLSFPFLAYAAGCLARWSAGRRPWPPLGVAAGAGLLMTLLDVVIDPLAVRGDRWFLGRIFFYPEGGLYFGVPLSNFVGWWVVGTLAVGGYLLLAGGRGGSSPGAGVALYYGVLGFNLAMTAWIGEWTLVAAGVALHAGTAGVLSRIHHQRSGAAARDPHEGEQG